MITSETKKPTWELKIDPLQPRVPESQLECDVNRNLSITVYDIKHILGGRVSLYLYLSDNFSDEIDIYARRDAALPALLEKLEEAAEAIRDMIDTGDMVGCGYGELQDSNSKSNSKSERSESQS